MFRTRLAALALMLMPALPAAAETYTPDSNTAQAITGRIDLDDAGITFENGAHMAFGERVADTLIYFEKPVKASVYRIAEPSDPVLLNGNSFCGQPVTYVATWADGKDRIVIAFTGPDVPKSDEGMCALYVYQ